MKCAFYRCENDAGLNLRTGKPKKYCSKKCAQRGGVEHALATDPKTKEAYALAWEKYHTAHPDARKKAAEKSTKKKYKSGKLPSWMFS